jgi:hypothetical protein
MLLPMAEAAKQAVGSPASLKVIADGGYSNGEQSETCETRGIVPYIAASIKAARLPSKSRPNFDSSRQKSRISSFDG